MSRFLSRKYLGLAPYTPGEQPQDRKYVKLNTNESPFPPSQEAVSRAAEAALRLNLYPDPECAELTRAVAALCGVQSDEVLLTNGSDEILNFAFMAFCDSERPAVFPDVTYGFYKVFAQLGGVPYEELPLRDGLRLEPSDYHGLGKTIFIANPSAPTGIALSVADIEGIVRSNPQSVVVIDEAYVDFGAESCIPLIHKYDNLLVTQTFSKSRSMAGARLGFGVGCRGLIQDLNAIKYSTNPYNINSMTMCAGLGVLEDGGYTRRNCLAIADNREYLTRSLLALGFETTPSVTNFVFARHPGLDGRALYLGLKARGVLVRHFDQERIRDYNRITIGSREQLDALLAAIRSVMESNGIKSRG